MRGFGEAVKAAIADRGIDAVAARCRASRPTVIRWASGVLPHRVAQASVLKAIQS